MGVYLYYPAGSKILSGEAKNSHNIHVFYIHWFIHGFYICTNTVFTRPKQSGLALFSKFWIYDVRITRMICA